MVWPRSRSSSPPSTCSPNSSPTRSSMNPMARQRACHPCPTSSPTPSHSPIQSLGVRYGQTEWFEDLPWMEVGCIGAVSTGLTQVEGLLRGGEERGGLPPSKGDLRTTPFGHIEPPDHLGPDPHHLPRPHRLDTGRGPFARRRGTRGISSLPLN
jgi:hypothetical protein